MAYRKFRANRLFDGYRFQEPDRVLITDLKGVVQDIVNVEDAGEDITSCEGILSPGLINCHCHLELSHLKNVIPPHTGLIEFLCSVVTKRGFDPEVIQAEIARADHEMYENGIVAVGDIGNTADTAAVKSRSKIRWQNFVEVLSFTDEKATENFKHYRLVAQQMQEALSNTALHHRTSLVPHAPYTISPETFRMINEATAGQVISIHNQEHPAEDELYRTGGGPYLQLFSIFDITASPFPVTGMSSIRSVLPYFSNRQTIFLVHNTFMSEEDIVWANAYAAEKGLQLIYCLCINANLYIENQTPPVDLLLKHNCTVVLGTDSYSSNWQLSIAREMASLKLHKGLEDEQVLRFATMNGAAALKWDDQLGSFEKKKQPGVVLLSNDLQQSTRLL